MADKRCYNLREAVQYFGLNRHSFEAHILPELKGKGIRVGACMVYEVRDLDIAWEAYKQKLAAHAAAAPTPQSAAGATSRSGRRSKVMTSAESGSAAWNAAVTKVLAKGKARNK
jgi:hypothetical protein